MVASDSLNRILNVSASISLSQPPTAVAEKESDLIPKDFVLSQNYPNPFNPSTDIQISIPHSSEIQLTIYSMLGQKVRTVAQGVFPSGIHTIHWDGKDEFGNSLASGFYLYQMRSGRFVQCKKMMLLK